MAGKALHSQILRFQLTSYRSNPGAEGKPKATSRKKKAGDDADGESPSKKRKTSAKRGKGGKAVAEEEDDNDDDYEEGGVKEGIKKEQIDGDD